MKITTKKVVWITIVILLLLVILFYKPILTGYAKFLTTNIKLKHSDIVVILGGNPTYRTDKAIELYKENYSKKIVIIKTLQMVNPKYKNLYLSNDKVSAKILKLHHTPYILLKPKKPVGSTQDEANTIKDYIIKNHNIKSVTLVTDNYHSYRAYHIFNYTFSKYNLKDVKLGVIYTTNNIFNETNWFKDSHGLSAYILETLKLFKYNYLKIKDL